MADGLCGKPYRTTWSLGIDMGQGDSISVYSCVCGFTAETAAEILTHLRGHGVTRVTVTPGTTGSSRRRSA
jgi:hypothetical protein